MGYLFDSFRFNLKEDRNYRRRFVSITSWTLGFAALIIAFLIVAPLFIDDSEPPPEEETEEEGEEVVDAPPEEDDEGGSENPISDLMTSFPEVESSEVEIEVDGQDITSSVNDSFTLSFSGMDIEEASRTCVISDPEEYCFVADSSLGTIDYTVFFFKDVAHTRFFRGAYDIEQEYFGQEEAAAFMTIPFGDDYRRILVVADSDSSGYVIFLPNNAIEADEERVLESLSVKE